ncbi:SDR family oxidoreductase [Methylobacterium oryzisoli]|uniref:SDR family oxidoreductase n=1 Tax=Methylobacterium oryzisoli TaxID=3385502 RepID=UPI003892460A
MSKTWLITGTSSGFGRLLTEKLLARGDTVVATVRRPAALDDLADRHGARLIVRRLDVADTAGLRTTADAAFEVAGRIDIVVSNAGYALFGAAEEASDAQVERQVATNLVGAIQLIRACLPHLRRQGGGRIVQISSEGGQIAYPGFSLYHATKWGIEGFVEAVAQEVAPFGIDFLLVEPGPTETGFRAGLDRTTPMPAYAATPAGDVRRAVDGGGFVLTGDAAKGADAIIAAADAERPPLRLVLGSTAYHTIARALDARRAALEEQRSVALAADVDGMAATRSERPAPPVATEGPIGEA